MPGVNLWRACLDRVSSARRAAGLARVHLEVRLALVGNGRLFRRAGFVEGQMHAHPGFEQPTYVSAEKRLDQAGRTFQG